MKNLRSRVFQASNLHATKRFKETVPKTINFQARFNNKFLIQFFRPSIFLNHSCPYPKVLTLHLTNAIQLRNLCHTCILFTHIVYHFWNKHSLCPWRSLHRKKFEWIGRMTGSLWLYWSKVWHFVATLIKISTSYQV